MRTTFAAREFTDDPVPDELLHAILDSARFAASGGNRQGWRVLVVRDPATRTAIADAGIPAAKRYFAQLQAGEPPFSAVQPSGLDESAIEAAQVPAGFGDVVRDAPVVLVVCTDLEVTASLDKDLDRVGIVTGSSVYPFVQNILLAARAEGYGGTITTIPIANEPALKELLAIPEHVAVCAIVPFGKPARTLTKLSRRPVADFAMTERWGGPPLQPRRES